MPGVRAARQARRARRHAVADPGRARKRTFLESDLPRIQCPEHGKITAAVPWARHDDRFSKPFEEFAAWKAAHMPWTRVSAELRVTWEALANITARVAADAAGQDRLGGLRRIGIDEKSWGKGSGKYLVIVTDHDAGRIVWTGEGRCQATVRRFFSDLGPERAKLLTHMSADGADWIYPVVREEAPQAKLCLDAFHVVKWANEKLDELRRRPAGELRAAGREDEAATLGTGMWALRKDERKLTPAQRGTLAQIAVVNKPLYKGYLIKEQIREGQRRQDADARRHRLGPPLPHTRVHPARQAPVPVYDPDSRYPLRRTLQRPRRSPQRPGQRPHHQSPRLPDRNRPHEHDPLRPRRHLPRLTLRVNDQPIPESRGEPPFGFMRFSPGPGVGGHCLPIDPSYLPGGSSGRSARDSGSSS